MRFAGLLERESLLAELARAHVFAFPSLWAEPFALATLEAMAHGLAVVASDAGGTPEQIGHGREGLLVPAGDAAALAAALERLGANEPERRALGRAARARVGERFTQARFLDGLEAALGRAAGRTAASPVPALAGGAR